MNRITSSGLPVTDGPTPAPEGKKRHFDTFETEFFKDGDAESAHAASAEAERFDDLDDGKRKGFAPSRRLVVGVVVGSACLAVIGCVALWRSGGHSTEETVVLSASPPGPTPAPTAAPVPAPAATPMAAEQTQVAVAAPIPAAPPAPVPVAAEQPQAAPAAAAPALAGAVPAVAPAVAAPVAAPSAPPAAPAPTAAAAAPVAPPVAPAPSAVPALSQPAALVQNPSAERPAAATGDPASTRVRCKEIAGSRRQKDLLSVCSDAFAADPSAADVAVILAKAEFDKGHAAQALAWSQKALAADPSAADAYVFIGGVEQSAGHNKAAKEAYKRYLQLAPGGRYAGDLRAIVGTL